MITVAAGLGISLNHVLESVGLKLPVFVTCLFGGILLSNTVPRIFRKLPWPADSPTMGLATSVSLGIFLAMSLMSVQLWLLVDLAVLLLISVGIQAVVVLAFTACVVFPLLGKRYESAVMSAGFVGLTLGATPTAVANMTAIVQRFGGAPVAFVVVPLVGAFFIDILNAVIINLFLQFFG
jgi:ESS family glutamate:Na+ symporter